MGKWGALVLGGVSLIMGSTVSARADIPDVRMGDPILRGNGCEPGTASATLSPDARALSVIFDRFMAEAGQGSATRQDRKMCNLEVPLIVPSGYTVSVTRVDYRGFNNLPSGAQSQFTAKFGVRDSRTSRSSSDLVQRFQGPLADEFLLSHSLDVRTWSSCGGTISLSLSAFINAASNRQGEFASISLDSEDLTVGARNQTIFYLDYQLCNGNGGGGGWNPPPRPPRPDPFPPGPGPRPPRPAPFPGPRR